MLHSQTLTSQTSNTWTQILSGPPPRDSYASVLWGDYIVIFGGSSDTITYNDVHAFHLVTQTWISPRQTRPARKVVPRSGHSMCLDQKGNFIIFGGLNNNNRLNKNSKLNWYTGFNLDISQNGELTMKWKTFPEAAASDEEDDCPSVAFHTANVYNNKMYVFGGLNERDVRVNELWELDLDAFIWRKPETTGNIPDPLFAHCSPICNSKLYIFGQNSKGTQFFALDLETFRWDRIETTGLPTNVRSGAVMQEYKGKLYLFGGGAHGCDSDLFVFCTQTNTWSEIHIPGELPAVRSLCNLIIYENKIYILGGKGYERSSPLDFWSLSLDNIDLNPPESDKTKTLKIQNDTFDLFELFTQKSFTDIILEVEGKEFPCHKAILAQRCKFFANLFNSGMSDSNLTRLPIMGVKVDSFEIMLRFIYGDPNLTIEEDLAFELLSMSDKYLLPTLKTECEKVLIKLLNLDNFTKIAKAAEVVESDELKKVVFKFAIQNVNTLKEKGDLYNLSQSLLIELFADIVSK